MDLVKFGHSCVRLTKDGTVLVIDPGSFSNTVDALNGADGVLITHEHADHVDVEAVRSAAQTNPQLRIWAPAATAAQFADLGERVNPAAADDRFDALGFDVQTFGGQHALIYPLIPIVANVAYLVDGNLYHPGDSFIVPTAPVANLLVPIHAPWSKTAEVIDFVTAVRPNNAFQIHDGLLNAIGLGAVEAHVSRFGARVGSAFRHLDDGDSLPLA